MTFDFLGWKRCADCCNNDEWMLIMVIIIMTLFRQFQKR